MLQMGVNDLSGAEWSVLPRPLAVAGYYPLPPARREETWKWPTSQSAIKIVQFIFIRRFARMQLLVCRNPNGGPGLAKPVNLTRTKVGTATTAKLLLLGKNRFFRQTGFFLASLIGQDLRALH